MKAFLRNNPTIAFGLGLPLLLVVVFLLISGIPTLLVSPPQFDVLYVTEYNNRQSGVQISVVDQKVQVTYHSNAQIDQAPRLWRYNPKTGAVREIPIILPRGSTQAGSRSAAPPEVPTTTIVDVPDLTGLTIDSSSIAPDGYEFSSARDRYSGNVFGGLFYSARYYNEPVLKKSGRSVRLPNTWDRYYFRNIDFVGWVVSQ